jgi:hypothetical protein
MTATALTFAATTLNKGADVGLAWVGGIVGGVALLLILAGFVSWLRTTPAQREKRRLSGKRARWEQQHSNTFTKVVQGYRTTSDSSGHLTRKVNSAVRSANARGYELIGKTTRYNGMGRGGTDVVLTFQRVTAQRR